MPGWTLTDKPRSRAPKRSYEPPTLARTDGPDPGTPVEDALLSIGVIVGTHGLGGEVRVKLFSDDPEHLMDIDEVLVGRSAQPYVIQSVRFHKGMALVTFEGVEDIDAAEALRNQPVRIQGAKLPPLEPNEYYLYQVIGIEARLEDGSVLGTVTDVIETGANMVFVVKPVDGGKDELFPSIPEVVVDLRPAEGVLILRRQAYWDDPA